MSREVFSLRETWKIVRYGDVQSTGPETLAGGYGAAILTIWWWIRGVPENAARPEQPKGKPRRKLY